MSLTLMSAPPATIDDATFAQVVRNLPTPLLVMDEQWIIRFANPALERLLGYQQGALEGLHIDRLVPAPLRGQYQSLRERSLQATSTAGVLFEGERIAVSEAGTEIPIQIAVARIVVAGNGYHISSFVDTSHGKQIELETIEQLQSIVEHSDVGIFVLQVTPERDFVFEAFNPVTEGWTGVSREQARGRTIEQVVPAAEADRVRENYRRCVDQGVPISYEEAPGAAAGYRAFQTTLVPIRNAQGRIHRLIGLSHDVTGQRQAESQLLQARRELDESEARFARIFSVSPLPIGITELASGRLIEVNEAFVRVFGHTRDQALGRTTLELGIWRDAGMREQMVNLVRERGSFRDLEVGGKSRQGRHLALVLSGEVIELGGQSCLVTYVHDVSEGRRDKLALAESEDRFAKAFRANPDAMVILQAKDSVLIEVNAGFARLSGYEREYVIGRTAAELGLWEDPAERERAAVLMRSHGTLRDFAIVAKTAKGVRRDCVMSCERIEIDGRPCVVATIRDITDSLAIERANADLEAQLRQAQKMDALGTLAGGIAHDFNNILGAMQAYMELIKLDLNEPEQISSHVAELGRATERAKELVRQILTFSRRQTQRRAPVRLDLPVRDAANLLRATLPATIRMETKIEARGPSVLADVTQIHQVVMNLGTNAAHAMRNGSGQFLLILDTCTVDEDTARSNPQLQARRYVRISVKDSGEGMSTETMKRMFDPFFTTKPMGEGTGLGLSVVHGIVRDHEGAIVVSSELGKGACFDVYLPEHDAALSENVEPQPDFARGKGQRILFVDDEVALCRSVGRLLGRLGYEVSVHSDVMEALGRFRADPTLWDAVLTDFTMPGMTGIEFAREVHAIAPEIPVVVMSGFSGSWNAESLRPMGITDLIAKPLSTARVSAVLAALFEGKPPT
jgi:PAS domain S-box-containing protein